jgi:hypothetical protein
MPNSIEIELTFKLIFFKSKGEFSTFLIAFFLLWFKYILYLINKFSHMNELDCILFKLFKHQLTHPLNKITWKETFAKYVNKTAQSISKRIMIKTWRDKEWHLGKFLFKIWRLVDKRQTMTILVKSWLILI